MRKEADLALAIDPRHIDTLLVEAVFSFKAPAVAGGDKLKARRTVEQIRSIAPVWGYLAEARLNELAGDMGPTTEAALNKAVQAAPSFYRARASLATYYCGEKTCEAPAAAERAALDAIAVDPGAAPSYEVLARVYVVEKRWADLEALLNRAEKAVPDNAGPFYSAADRLIESGQDFNRAERYLQRYLGQPPEGREPTMAEARCLLAEMYERSGRKDDALRQLDLALRIQPDYEPAKKDLNRLRHL
jgi:tetratricopeptide (TPR) repeat protein